MDSGRFDTLSKVIGAGSSRRSLLKRLAAGGAAAVIGTAGLRGAMGNEVAAANRKRRCRAVKGVPIGSGNVPNATACTNNAMCASGYCNPGTKLCAVCPRECKTRTGTLKVCCIEGNCKDKRCTKCVRR